MLTPTPYGQEASIPAEFVEEDPTKECQICLDTKHTDLYPQTTEASDCRCLSDACLVCLQEHIKTQMSSKEWCERSITCPICNRSLVFREIEEYADGETFATHTSRMINRAVEDMPYFTRCPNPACTSGQVHDNVGGVDAQPVVTCTACGTTFCFRHRIPLGTQGPGTTTSPSTPPSPSPHENMSCDEYDAYLADPLHFRSDHQVQQERAEQGRRELEAVQRARGRVEEALLQRRERLEWERERVEGEMEKQREREAAARERQGRLERARLERELYEGAQEREERDRRRRAEEVHRRRVEDQWSEQRIEVSTKPCPRCAARIEKNEGW